MYFDAFLCNDISFIFRASTMFLANRHELEVYELDQNVIKLPMVKLPFVHHLFMCEIQEFEPYNEEVVSLTPCFVTTLECLSELANANKLARTYLISPAYMNNPEGWSLNRLMGISRAEYKYENRSGYVYRYEIEHGQYLDLDISGLIKDKKELSFVSILKLEDSNLENKRFV